MPSIVEARSQHLDLERPRAQHALDLVRGDGADLAELLHDDDVGLHLGPALLVDRVERAAVPGVSATSRSISALVRSPVWMRGGGDDRLRGGLRGQSHSWVTPTTSSPSPSAKSTSVAAGTSEQIHGLRLPALLRNEADLAARLEHRPAHLRE